MSFWSVVQTHSQRENAAADHLKDRGFEVYLPRIKVLSGNGYRRIVPLFPGYLFVRITHGWYPIVSTAGVMRLLRNGNQPAKIEDDIVREIQTREVGGIIKLPRRLQIGDQVRILRGAFKDFIGIYDGMSGKERECVLLELLGRKVPLELGSDDFVPLNIAP